MTAQEALTCALGRLRNAGVADVARDARLLLAHAMGLPPDRLTLHLADQIDPEAERRFDAAIAARVLRQPVSQITGRRMFWGRNFLVTPDVLDPRPETETLVAAALEASFAHVLDLGTGTGCILVTLLHERPGSQGLGVDVSPAALTVAGANRRLHGMEDRMLLRLGSWFDPVDQSFDLIVANPPYIAADEMPDLAPEVRDHEPLIALTPGGDGLDAYRRIAAGAPGHLKPGGRLIVEIGLTQAAEVSSLFAAAGLRAIELRQDMDRRDRVVVAMKPN